VHPKKNRGGWLKSTVTRGKNNLGLKYAFGRGEWEKKVIFMWDKRRGVKSGKVCLGNRTGKEEANRQEPGAGIFSNADCGGKRKGMVIVEIRREAGKKKSWGGRWKLFGKPWFDYVKSLPRVLLKLRVQRKERSKRGGGSVTVIKKRTKS